MQGEHLGKLWLSLSKICVVMINTVVITDHGDSVFRPNADLSCNFSAGTGGGNSLAPSPASPLSYFSSLM